MNTWVRRVTTIGIMLFGMELAAQRTDPSLGTWVLNIAKSSFSPGPAPKGETRTHVLVGQDTKVTFKGVDEPRMYRMVRQEIKVTSETEDADGKRTTAEWTVGFDGKDHPMTSDPDADTLSARRIDAFTMEFTRKKVGRVVMTCTRAISQDGMVMTITAKGIDGQGRIIHNVAVFEKQ